MSSALQQAKSYAKYNNDLLMANTRQAQAYNAAEAAKNRDWQERLSNSAHQREVADLKKAGLNPVLSAGGQGATTGSGASASSDAAGVDTSMVGAVIDMATAQLNSATQLQTTAMQTAASIANNIRDNDTARWKWQTPSAESVVGQVMNAGSLIDIFANNLSSSKTVQKLKGFSQNLYGSSSKADIVDALTAMSGLPGFIAVDRTRKTNAKYSRYNEWKERPAKPKKATQKAYSMKNNGFIATTRNTHYSNYHRSSSFRKKWDRNMRSMNVHYRKF